MEAHNYELVRKNKHLIWRHRVTHRRVVTSVSASDHRALANIERTAKAGARVTT